MSAGLSADSLRAIDAEVAKYPEGKSASAIMSALRIAQKEKQWLDNDTIEFVADYLAVPAIRAYEVATFYNMYDLKPRGKKKLCLCTNLPCLLMGAQKTAEALKQQLGIGFGETTPDKAFTLVEGECFGACGEAPVIITDNEKMHSHITADRVPDFIKQLKNGEAK